MNPRGDTMYSRLSWTTEGHVYASAEWRNMSSPLYDSAHKIKKNSFEFSLNVLNEFSDKFAAW